MRYDDFDRPRRGNIFRHAGFRVGAVVGLVLSAVHWALFLTLQTDLAAYLIHPFAYFMAARTAAQQHHDAQSDSVDHWRGVPGTGIGAALVTSLLVWFSIILFFVIADLLSGAVNFYPINAYCLITIDGLVAMGLGALGGNMVVRKYGDSTGWDG